MTSLTEVVDGLIDNQEATVRLLGDIGKLLIDFNNRVTELERKMEILWDRHMMDDEGV